MSTKKLSSSKSNKRSKCDPTIDPEIKHNSDVEAQASQYMIQIFFEDCTYEHIIQPKSNNSKKEALRYAYKCIYKHYQCINMLDEEMDADEFIQFIKDYNSNDNESYTSITFWSQVQSTCHNIHIKPLDEWLAKREKKWVVTQNNSMHTTATTSTIENTNNIENNNDPPEDNDQSNQEDDDDDLFDQDDDQKDLEDSRNSESEASDNVKAKFLKDVIDLKGDWLQVCSCYNWHQYCECTNKRVYARDSFFGQYATNFKGDWYTKIKQRLESKKQSTTTTTNNNNSNK